MMQQICSECRCSVVASKLYNGQPFCESHYTAKLEEELYLQFELWISGDDPSKRFRYLLGRLSGEGVWSTVGNSYLSAARIRDRGYGFSKTKTGCMFKITRHPEAFRKGVVTRRIVETWEVDFRARRFQLLHARDWQQGNPDI